MVVFSFINMIFYFFIFPVLGARTDSIVFGSTNRTIGSCCRKFEGFQDSEVTENGMTAIHIN